MLRLRIDQYHHLLQICTDVVVDTTTTTTTTFMNTSIAQKSWDQSQLVAYWKDGLLHARNADMQTGERQREYVSRWEGVEMTRYYLCTERFPERRADQCLPRMAQTQVMALLPLGFNLNSFEICFQHSDFEDVPSTKFCNLTFSFVPAVSNSPCVSLFRCIPDSIQLAIDCHKFYFIRRWPCSQFPRDTSRS